MTDRTSDALRVAAACAYAYGVARERHGQPMSEEKQARGVQRDIDEAVRRGMHVFRVVEPDADESSPHVCDAACVGEDHSAIKNTERGSDGPS